MHKRLFQAGLFQNPFKTTLIKKRFQQHSRNKSLHLNRHNNQLFCYLFCCKNQKDFAFFLNKTFFFDFKVTQAFKQNNPERSVQHQKKKRVNFSNMNESQDTSDSSFDTDEYEDDSNNKDAMTSQLVAKEARLIIQNWIRISNIKIGWINEFDEIVFSPDGSKIVSSSKDKIVRIWDIASRKQIQSCEGHTNYVYGVAFSPDGYTIVSCSWDETIRLWDVESGMELMKLGGCLGFVLDVSFSPDGASIVSASSNNMIQLWDAHSGKEIHKFISHSYIVSSAQFSSDGTMIVSSSHDKTIDIWNVKSGERLKQLIGHSDYINYAEFSPDCKFVASCSRDKTIRIWHVQSEKQVKLFREHADVVNDVRYFPHGQTIVSSSNDGTIRLWDVNSGTFAFTEIFTKKSSVCSVQCDIQNINRPLSFSTFFFFLYTRSCFIKYFVQNCLHKVKRKLRINERKETKEKEVSFEEIEQEEKQIKQKLLRIGFMNDKIINCAVQDEAKSSVQLTKNHKTKLTNRDSNEYVHANAKDE
ncbi:WD-40 repeat protein [Reticulomyxa filosa]|uniref:WD-40 repeat protein n=1 Tax=Reticulomyxa filosa TaxID=46433 RepID=X6P0R5_RETFI|nr:WD-40 repeat protein [Reticulomyxa filosa]|eukprot:ETO31669.1 WD-40 repeat protein [Reticulomyxa filosa]